MNPNFISVEGLMLPNEPLSNIQLINAAKILKIKNFKGVFVRDQLPEKQSRNAKCDILNLDSSFGPGTHWTAWYRSGSRSGCRSGSRSGTKSDSKSGEKLYFDSYGLRPQTNLSNIYKDLFSTTMNESNLSTKSITATYTCTRTIIPL